MSVTQKDSEYWGRGLFVLLPIQAVRRISSDSIVICTHLTACLNFDIKDAEY